MGKGKSSRVEMKKWDCWATAQSLVRHEHRLTHEDEMHLIDVWDNNRPLPFLFLKTLLLTLDIAFYSSIIVHGRVTDSF